jgi:hypothetical protein
MGNRTLKMRVTAVAVLFVVGSPAFAEGFNITQLIQADFKLKAAVAGAPGRSGQGSDILYLQGKLPGGTYEVIMRCVARPDPEEGEANCQQVY